MRLLPEEQFLFTLLTSLTMIWMLKEVAEGDTDVLEAREISSRWFWWVLVAC